MNIHNVQLGEGLVNALIHRSYLELGSEVHIDMFDDCLEIYSPNGLLNGGSIKDMAVMNMSLPHLNLELECIFLSIPVHFPATC